MMNFPCGILPFFGNPTAFVRITNLGVVYNSQGLHEKAEYEYEKTLEMKPGDAGSHYNLGNLYERKGLIEDAISEYERAIQYNSIRTMLMRIII
ncbi:MAG: tetratricopeptide repeat protein [Candidatus Kuenenia sp.]|nr:tetratricopeptide repeat protein [Candidatus Kuenenia hertensis]